MKLGRDIQLRVRGLQLRVKVMLNAMQDTRV